MNCPDARRMIHAYIDRELDVIRALDFEQHIHECAKCAGQQKSLRSLRAALTENDLAYRAPAALRKRVCEIVTVPEATPARPSKSGMVTLWQWLAIGAAALAVVVLMLRPVGISAHDELLDEVVASHVRSLLANHLTDVASSNQHTVKPWFDGRLDFAPEVRDFGQDGFPLIGGRLDYLNTRTVAALVYQHNKHIINVFIWPETKPGNASDGPETVRGYSIIEFDANGFSYCLISDTEAPALELLSKLLRRE